MVKITDDSIVVIEHAHAAFAAAAEDVLVDARTGAPHLTGAYAASLALNSAELAADPTATIASGLRRGPAVEFGANVGTRRGPHMSGSHSVTRAVARFGERMTARLAQTPMGKR